MVPRRQEVNFCLSNHNIIMKWLISSDPQSIEFMERHPNFNVDGMVSV